MACFHDIFVLCHLKRETEGEYFKLISIYVSSNVFCEWYWVQEHSRPTLKINDLERQHFRFCICMAYMYVIIPLKRKYMDTC